MSGIQFTNDFAIVIQFGKKIVFFWIPFPGNYIMSNMFCHVQILYWSLTQYEWQQNEFTIKSESG